MYSAGSDIIFTATAGGDFGVFEGAQENNFKVLSVDVNRCVNAPGYIIDNTLKGVDAAILNSVDVIKNGAEASFTAVGLKEGGMGLMALKPDLLEKSKCLIAEHGIFNFWLCPNLIYWAFFQLKIRYNTDCKRKIQQCSSFERVRSSCSFTW